MASDKFQGRRWASVTPSDTVNIPNVSTEDGTGNSGNVLFVGTGGDLVVVSMNDDVETFKNIQDGSFIPIHAKRINATGTTATDIIAIW